VAKRKEELINSELQWNCTTDCSDFACLWA